MKCIRYYHNHNTGECTVWFGTPFLFDGPLFNLPKERDGKMVHVLGLTPHTVDLEIPIRPEKSTEAYWLTVNGSFVPDLINHLKAISIPQ